MSEAIRYITVWTGGPFPYPALLALASILAVDPSATVELHHLDALDHSFDDSALRSTGRFETHRVDLTRLLGVRLLQKYLQIPSDSLAAKSNLIRIALLHRRGGVYVDLDTFTLRPLGSIAAGAFVGSERVWRHDRQRTQGGLSVAQYPGTAAWATAWALKRVDCAVAGGRLRMARRLRRLDRMVHVEQLNNAVIGAPAGSDLTAALLDRALQCDPRARYALGPALLEDTVASDPSLATVFEPDLFYAVPPGESHRLFWDRTLELPRSAAVVHYVGSNHRSLIERVGAGDRRFERPEVFWRLGRQAQVWLHQTDVLRRSVGL